MHEGWVFHGRSLRSEQIRALLEDGIPLNLCGYDARQRVHQYARHVGLGVGNTHKEHRKHASGSSAPP